MQGTFNFRDLGGIVTQNKEKIKPQMIFRSDDLHNLTPSDLNYLNSINLKTIIDFRSKEEINLSPDKLPTPTNKYLQLSIEPGNLLNIVQKTDINKLTKEDVDQLMLDLYMHLVTDKESLEKFKIFFKNLEDSTNLPILFHCSAGKDRTGIACALFLQALDVDYNIILDDYLLSNNNLKTKYSIYINKYPQLEGLFSVKAIYLESAFNTIKNKYISLTNFLIKTLDVDIDKIKKNYLLKTLKHV